MELTVEKPVSLKKGDIVAVLSPSWGGPHQFPHIFDNGLKNLKEDFGLKIKEYPTARMKAKELYDNPKIRADDINNAFNDKEVKAIFVSIGGDDSIRILRYLDKTTILKNPKIIMGYSDTTTLLMHLNQLGMVTFSGPCVMAGFSQIENFPECEKHINELLFTNPLTYEYRPYSEWSSKYLDFSDVKDTGKVSEKIKNEGWHWIQGEEVVEGKLFGGNIEILEMLKGTEFWPSPDFWKGKILFFETSEEKPSPDYVKYALRSFGVQGIFDRISGILVGRARDYTDDEKRKLEENVISVVSKEFNHPEIPIIANMDFGHTEPQFILPLGITAEIDCRNKRFRLLEPPLKIRS